MSKLNEMKLKRSVPHDLDYADRSKIARMVNQLIADVFALFIKTKNFHWHLSGSHFRDYHLLLDEQAQELFAMIDPLAERVRKLGNSTLRSIGDIAKLQKIKDNDLDFVPARVMIEELVHDNKHLTRNCRTAQKLCSDSQDYATSSLFDAYIDQSERRTWFLFALLED